MPALNPVLLSVLDLLERYSVEVRSINTGQSVNVLFRKFAHTATSKLAIL